MQERPITVVGTTVNFHAWEHDSSEYTYDYHDDVKMLDSVISDLYSLNLEKLICIEGRSRTGKSTFARVLKSIGAKCELIDVVSALKNGELIAPKISDTTVTYLIDEMSFAEVEALSKAIVHAKAGGCIVLFVQSIDEVRGALEFDSAPVYFRLERSGLSKII